MKLGVIVTKVHRAIQYKQEYIFKEYVDMNTRKRKAATSKFEKDFYKLKNNSLYGKTVENLKNRINLRLCTKEAQLVTYASNPRFRRSIRISGELVVVLLLKDEVVLNRPSYIGQSVLDISKLRMYQLQYRQLEDYRERFQCEISFVAGDTDSFFLKTKGVELNTLLAAMKDDGLLDTSTHRTTLGTILFILMRWTVCSDSSRMRLKGSNSRNGSSSVPNVIVCSRRIWWRH